jgi:hypothetical protein
MFDLSGNPITYSFALLYALMALRLSVDYSHVIISVVINLVRRAR